MAVPAITVATVQDWTQVNADAQGVSATLASNTKFSATLLMDYARLSASAQVGNGTLFEVQVPKVSSPANCDDDWQTIWYAESAILVGATGTLTNTEAIGATVIETAGTAVKKDRIFIQNATLGNSELVQAVSVVGATSFTLGSGLKREQAAGENWYNKAEQFMCVVRGVTAVRVRVINNNGTTNQNIAYRVIAHTEDSIA